MYTHMYTLGNNIIIIIIITSKLLTPPLTAASSVPLSFIVNGWVSILFILPNSVHNDLLFSSIRLASFSTGLITLCDKNNNNNMHV